MAARKTARNPADAGAVSRGRASSDKGSYTEAESAYSADSLTVLEGLDAVRKRPGMYIGSTDSRGLQHLVWEILDNSVDEATAGHCTAIDLILHQDGSVETRDNGRGIPVDIEPTTGLSGLELIFTKLHAGGKFGGGSYGAAGGLHGVGASVVNALSSRLEAEVDRGGYTWQLAFAHGEPGQFTEDGDFTPGHGVEQGKKIAKGKTGTRVRYWPDAQIFLVDATLDVDQIYERCRQIAFLVPGLVINVCDYRDSDKGDHREEKFHSSEGIVDFCDYLTVGDGICDVIHVDGTSSFTENVPVLEGDHLVQKEVERQCGVDVALRWGTGWDTEVRSFVNTVMTPKGGTHVTGFDRALTRVVNEALREAKILKDKDEGVTKDDVQEGLVAVVRVEIAEPQFEGQTKEILGTAAAQTIVYAQVAETLRTWFVKGKKNQTRMVLQKIAGAAKARLAARTQRETVRRKNALESSAMPAKLADCRTHDLDRSELILVEGDSAMGSAKAARDSEFQALLPLRGKIINAAKSSTKQVLDNAECAAIFTTVGGGSGRNFDIEASRYGRLVLMSVAGDEPVLTTTADGKYQLKHIGEQVGRWLEVGDDIPDAQTVSFDPVGLSARTSPLKKVIRHHYQGTMRRITTQYGRAVSVTAGHSVFTWDDGVVGLREANTLEPGDLVIVPRQLPRQKDPTYELDLVRLLLDGGLAQGIRVEGESVRSIKLARLEKTLAHAGRATDTTQRVALDAHVWRRLALKRQACGITQKQMAHRLGYKQPISVCTWEKKNGYVPLPAFKAYLAAIDEEWPAEARIIPSQMEYWSQGDDKSAHARYRKTSPAAWLTDLTSEEVEQLGRDVIVYTRAHRDIAKTRYMAIDEDMCELFGWYMAEGSSTTRGQIRLALGTDDNQYVDRLKEMVRNTFNQELRVTKVNGRDNSLCAWFFDGVGARLIQAVGLGGTARHKRVPDLMLNLDESNQLAFLAGYYLGDGTKGISTKALAFNTASRELASSLSYLFGQLGIVTSTSWVEPSESTMLDGHVISNTGRYSITVCGHGQMSRMRRIWRDGINADLVRKELAGASFSTGLRGTEISDTLIAVPITSIEDSEVDEDVYDFSVAEDESFIVGFGGGICAHNTDADVDGSHIRVLLLTLFYHYMRPMLEAGRIFAAMPPLFKTAISGSKEEHYTYTDEEQGALESKLEKAGKKVKEVQRYKGLGEMDADQLRDTTMDPTTRSVCQITVEDAEAAALMFDILMGPDVAPRKEFIIDNSDLVDRETLDI